jgi:hypothetical protein
VDLDRKECSVGGSWLRLPGFQYYPHPFPSYVNLKLFPKYLLSSSVERVSSISLLKVVILQALIQWTRGLEQSKYSKGVLFIPLHMICLNNQDRHNKILWLCNNYIRLHLIPKTIQHCINFSIVSMLLVLWNWANRKQT